MKIFGIVMAVLIALLVGVYILLFTGMGHGVTLPIIEEQIEDSTKLKNVKFKEFDLDMNSLNTTLLVENNPIKIDAKYDLSGNLDATYYIIIKDLSIFKELTQTAIKGAILAKGKLYGGEDDNVTIKGVAKLADGYIKYDVDMQKDQIEGIDFEVTDLSLSKLLDMLGQPPYLQGLLQAKGKISSQNLDNIDFTATVKNGKIDKGVMKKELGIDIPKSNFTLQSKATIANQKGDYIVSLKSPLANIKSKGNLDLSTMGIDAVYDLNIVNLAILEPIIATKLQGKFATQGHIKGDKHNMVVEGSSPLASSKTIYRATLKDMAIDHLLARVKNAQLDQLLYMFNQPKYAKGELNIDTKISSISNLDGSVITTINKGLLNRAVLKKEFDLSPPSNSNFTLKTNTKLKNSVANSTIDLKSFAANLTTKQTKFDIKNSKLATDYTLDITSLSKLYFVTKQKMNGALKITGDVKFDKQLLASFHTKKFGGRLDGKLDGDKLGVKIKNFQTLPLLGMLDYPKIFKSTMNATLVYNLLTKKGLSKIDMGGGKFMTNKAMTLIKKYTKYDLTAELYSKASINTKINDHMLYNDLHMKSAKSLIKSKKLTLNTKSDTIDADIDVGYQKYKLGIKLKGATQSPSVSVDPGDILRQKAKERASKLIEKKLGDRAPKNVKGLLNKLF